MKFDDIELSKKIERLTVDIVITDENGRLISPGNSERPLSESKIEIPRLLSGGKDSTNITNQNVGEFTYNMLIQSYGAGIPQMSKMNIQIREIGLFDKIGNPVFKQIKGKWDFNIELNEKFKKANKVAYTCQSSNNNEGEIISAEMFPSGFIIKFIVNTPYAKDEYLDEIIWQKVKLTDLQGNEYSMSGGLSGERTKDGKFLISMPFEVTNFDQVDYLKFTVKDLKGKDFETILVKKQ